MVSNSQQTQPNQKRAERPISYYHDPRVINAKKVVYLCQNYIFIKFNSFKVQKFKKGLGGSTQAGRIACIGANSHHLSRGFHALLTQALQPSPHRGCAARTFTAPSRGAQPQRPITTVSAQQQRTNAPTQRIYTPKQRRSRNSPRAPSRRPASHTARSRSSQPQRLATVQRPDTPSQRTAAAGP